MTVYIYYYIIVVVVVVVYNKFTFIYNLLLSYHLLIMVITSLSLSKDLQTKVQQIMKRAFS